MTSPDEQVLSQRLHRELGELPAPAAPVAAVIRRGSARRARRWAAAASGLAAVTAVAVAVPLLSSHGQPGRPGRHAGQVTRTGPSAPPPVLTGTTFAAGTAAGRPWRLSVRNIADPGARCLPAIMLNATDGYLPPLGGGVAGSNVTGGQLPPAGAGVAGSVASLAFLTSVPGQPEAGFAALRVAPDVTRLTVVLRSGGTLAVHPVTVRACGQRLPLAGFSYPPSGVASITAYAGTQVLTRVAPPVSLFTQTAAPGPPGPAGATLRLVPGVWQQLWRTPGAVAAGTVAAGQAGSTRWQISVQLGAAGDCFLGRTFDGQVATQATSCAPIAVAPRTVALRRFLIQQHTGLTGYAGLASPRAGYLIATLSGGGSLRVRPAQIGGRQYVALALPADRRLTGVTVYDRAGRALGMVRFSSAGS